MRTWKKYLALLLSVMMFMTMLPASVIGTEAEEIPDPIVEADVQPDDPGEGGIVPDPEPADTAPEAEPQEYSNDADILPDGGGKSDIFAKLANRGYLYLSTSGKEFTVYADSKREAEDCRVVKDGFSVLYVDGRDGDMIHVRFTDQFGKEHAGYIGIGDFTLLSDEEASDIAVAFSIPSVLVEGVEIFGTEIFVEEAEEPEPQPEEEAVIAPDEEVIASAEEQKNDEAAGDQQDVQEDVQEDAQPANAEEPKQDEAADIQPDIAPDEKQGEPVKEEIQPIVIPDAKPAEKQEENKDDNIEPAAIEPLPVQGESKTVASRNVDISVVSGDIPEGAAVVSSQYSAADSKRIYDKYVLGIEEEPVKLRGRMLKSAAKSVANDADIAPELSGEAAEGNYAEGVTTKQIPGKAKTGTQSGYAVFGVGIDVNGVEFTGTGEFNVTIRPENDINIRSGIREDAEIKDVSFELYHVHNGVEKIDLPKENVVVSADGTIVNSPSEEQKPGVVMFRGPLPNDISDITKAATNLIGTLDYMEWIDNRRWNMVTVDGITVMLPEDDPTAAIASLVVLNDKHGILSKNIKTIDMRDNARILVK